MKLPNIRSHVALKSSWSKKGSEILEKHINVVCSWYKGHGPQSKLMHMFHGDEE